MAVQRIISINNLHRPLTGRLFGFFEIKYHPVNAISQAGGRGAVFKNMAEVGLASPALHLGTPHAV